MQHVEPCDFGAQDATSSCSAVKSSTEDVGRVARRETRWAGAGHKEKRYAVAASIGSEEVETDSTLTAVGAETAVGHKYSGAGHAEKAKERMQVSSTEECDTTWAGSGAVSVFERRPSSRRYRRTCIRSRHLVCCKGSGGCNRGYCLGWSS